MISTLSLLFSLFRFSDTKLNLFSWARIFPPFLSLSFDATTQKHKIAGMETFYGRSSRLMCLALDNTRLV